MNTIVDLFLPLRLITSEELPRYSIFRSKGRDIVEACDILGNYFHSSVYMELDFFNFIPTSYLRWGGSHMFSQGS